MYYIYLMVAQIAMRTCGVIYCMTKKSWPIKIYNIERVWTSWTYSREIRGNHSYLLSVGWIPIYICMVFLVVSRENRFRMTPGRVSVTYQPSLRIQIRIFLEVVSGSGEGFLRIGVFSESSEPDLYFPIRIDSDFLYMCKNTYVWKMYAFCKKWIISFRIYTNTSCLSTVT